MKPIRNSAKAIIIEDGKLLLTKNKDEAGVFYLLPGGGQEPGETVIEALHRECMEEIGAEIEVGDIKFIREYIGKNHEFTKWDAELHQVEFMFQCSLKTGVSNGENPDTWQVGIEWIDIKQLSGHRVYPSILKDLIQEDGMCSNKIYLGDVN